MASSKPRGQFCYDEHAELDKVSGSALKRDNCIEKGKADLRFAFFALWFAGLAIGCFVDWPRYDSPPC